jgi:hypothetical protein
MREYNGKSYNDRHGGCFDRGSADSYYHRGRDPHYYVGATSMTAKVKDLTAEELEAYHAGYDYNEQYGDKKNWD